MLQVTESESGGLRAVAAGDAGLVARVEVRGRSPFQQDRAEYEVSLWRDGQLVCEESEPDWHGVLPRVCHLMNTHGGRGTASSPVPDKGDLQARLRRLFGLMSNRS